MGDSACVLICIVITINMCWLRQYKGSFSSIVTEEFLLIISQFYFTLLAKCIINFVIAVNFLKETQNLSFFVTSGCGWLG